VIAQQGVRVSLDTSSGLADLSTFDLSAGLARGGTNSSRNECLMSADGTIAFTAQARFVHDVTKLVCRVRRGGEVETLARTRFGGELWSNHINFAEPFCLHAMNRHLVVFQTDVIDPAVYRAEENVVSRALWVAAVGQSDRTRIVQTGSDAPVAVSGPTGERVPPILPGTPTWRVTSFRRPSPASGGDDGLPLVLSESGQLLIQTTERHSETSAVRQRLLIAELSDLGLPPADRVAQ
jgi:hypothetical protein